MYILLFLSLYKTLHCKETSPAYFFQNLAETIWTPIIRKLMYFEQILKLLEDSNYTSSIASWRTSNTTTTFTTDCPTFSRFLTPNSNLGLIQNHILLFFKINLYKSRKYERVTLNGVIKNIANVITIERNIANNDTKKIEIHNKKWRKMQISLTYGVTL